MFTETKIFTPETFPGADPDFVPPNIWPSLEDLGDFRLSPKEKVRRKAFGLLGEHPYPWNPPQKKIDGGKVRRILIFRYDAVGDYIISTTAIRWLRQALPQAELHMITSNRNDALVRIDPFISRTFPIDQRHGFHPSWFPMIQETRKIDYDVILGMVFTRMTKCAYLAKTIAPNAEKVTLMHRERRDTYGQVFNRQVDRHEWKEHWATTMLHMASETFEPVIPPGPETQEPYMMIEHDAWRRVELFLKERGLRYPGLTPNMLPTLGWRGDLPGAWDGEPYCIINISAFTTNRQWRSDRCVYVCRDLMKSYPRLKIFISSAPSDLQSAQHIVRTLDDPRVEICAMKLTDFMAFVRGASFVISPDTATVHIAAIAKVPVVGLYAEYIKVAEWYPFRTPFVIVLSTKWTSINVIEPQKVVEATHMLIDRVGLTF